MKKLALFFFFVFSLFVVGFSFARFRPEVATFLNKQEIQTPFFKPTLYPLQNHSFAIIVIGRNNGAVVDKTLRSILSQNYENFRVIYIDNGSSDGSFHQVRNEIYENNQAHRVLLIQNEKPLHLAENLIRAVEFCNDNEIVLLVGGEDLLAHEWTLQRLNQYYANPDLWMTIGKYLNFPSLTPGCRPNLAEVRTNIPPPLYLKSFYAALFKKINPSDLMIHGGSIPESADFSYMVPLLEMAKGHVQYLDEVLYLVTKHPEIDEELRSNLEVAFREKPAYFPISQLFERKL